MLSGNGVVAAKSHISIMGTNMGLFKASGQKELGGEDSGGDGQD